MPNAKLLTVKCLKLNYLLLNAKLFNVENAKC